MTTPFKTLCDTYHFDREEQLDALRSWCHQQVSSDTRYSGTLSEQHVQYLDMAQHYLDHFLSNIPALVSETTPLFDHFTALQYAALKGYDHYILSASKRQPIIFNQQTPSGMTPLHLAAAGGHLHVVNALLDRGADPVKTNKNHQLPIFNALFVPMLFDEAIIRQKELIFTALNLAAHGTLLHQDSSGDTVFHLMATHGFESLLGVALKQAAGAAFVSNNFSKYPIHTAILNQQCAVAHLLLQVPTVATLTDAYGQNALHYAARYGTPEMVQICCEASNDINAVDKEDKTALWLAMDAKNDQALPILIQFGADASLTEPVGFVGKKR